MGLNIRKEKKEHPLLSLYKERKKLIIEKHKREKEIKEQNAQIADHLKLLVGKIAKKTNTLITVSILDYHTEYARTILDGHFSPKLSFSTTSMDKILKNTHTLNTFLHAVERDIRYSKKLFHKEVDKKVLSHNTGSKIIVNTRTAYSW